MFEQEDTEQAIEYFTRLCRYYPQSEYYEDAVGYLKRLDAAVPEAASEDDLPQMRGKPKGLVGGIIENISHPRLENISKDGVLFKKADTPTEALERALSFSAAQPGDSQPRSTTTVVNQ